MDRARLDKVALFASLSEVDRGRLARWAQEVNVEAGERLVREGRPAYEFFVIEDGTAAVTQGGERVAELGPGDFFGEIALLETGRRTATVTAETPMRLIALYGPPFRQLEREMPDFPRRVREAVSERLRRG